MIFLMTSCNNSTEINEGIDSKGIYTASSNEASSESNDIAKENLFVDNNSVFQLSQEELGVTVENNEQHTKDIPSCGCSCDITKGDAILIAQGHYFATKTPTNISKHIMTAKIIEEVDNQWHVLIFEKCLGRCDEKHIVLGGGYLYKIDKDTGEIIDTILQN